MTRYGKAIAKYECSRHIGIDNRANPPGVYLSTKSCICVRNPDTTGAQTLGHREPIPGDRWQSLQLIHRARGRPRRSEERQRTSVTWSKAKVRAASLS